MKLSELENLGYLYDPDHYSWLRRHILNRQVKNQFRRALRAGQSVEVANFLVAEELHRYYRVPKERITVLHTQE